MTDRRKRKRPSATVNATFPVDSTTNTGYAIGAVPPVTGSAIAPPPPPVTFVDVGCDGCVEFGGMPVYLEELG